MKMYRPHAFRVVTTPELHAQVLAGLRALTLTPTLDCTFYDPAESDVEGRSYSLAREEGGRMVPVARTRS
jgi:hypothetical protein